MALGPAPVLSYIFCLWAILAHPREQLPFRLEVQASVPFMPFERPYWSKT
jgi:hypothetical protein